ncbi:hypothetical protein COLO4_06903 [Corchorus olitorius]|uniref:Uncharacterized protein n=1 Tax=Corchorus olitorius TaxID=93759 RepID=A0A1R3KLL0_9ROSI|nr:hypothetical protein COLO4_06903 [Corchorus olitorius]
MQSNINDKIAEFCNDDDTNEKTIVAEPPSIAFDISINEKKPLIEETPQPAPKKHQKKNSIASADKEVEATESHCTAASTATHPKHT